VHEVRERTFVDQDARRDRNAAAHAFILRVQAAVEDQLTSQRHVTEGDAQGVGGRHRLKDAVARLQRQIFEHHPADPRRTLVAAAAFPLCGRQEPGSQATTAGCRKAADLTWAQSLPVHDGDLGRGQGRGEVVQHGTLAELVALDRHFTEARLGLRRSGLCPGIARTRAANRKDPCTLIACAVAAARHRPRDCIADHLPHQRVGPVRRRGDQVRRLEPLPNEVRRGAIVRALRHPALRPRVRAQLDPWKCQQQQPRCDPENTLHAGRA